MKPISFNWQNGGGYGNANEGLAVSEDHTGPLSRSQVGAVAFDTTQITSAANYSNPQPGDPCHPLAAGAHPPAVAFAQNNSHAVETDVAATITKLGCSGTKGGLGAETLIGGMQVRRLTPVECARLQGFPDTYLDIPYRGKPAADGPKYKALGNSMAVPVMRWIGERIAMVDALLPDSGGSGSGE